MNAEDSENAEQPACDAQSNLPRETVFYAVYIPSDKDSTKEDDERKGEKCVHIYEDMPGALEVIKKNKLARMKNFKNHADAVAYAIHGHELSVTKTSAVAKVQEKSSNLKSLKPEDLLSLKKLIEEGELDSIEDLVWENPRYLISNGDTPALLKIGPRHNALHIAAKANKPQICEYILNTVSDPVFLAKYRGKWEEEENMYFAEIMLDLYLNTPDKGLNETPLHHAVKYGYKDVVQVLVSYTQCIKTLQNKYQQMPVDIICSRKCTEDEDLKREIRMLLEDQFYVPVLRAEGNICPPIIGEPFSPISPPNLNRDPISPRVEVRAFAGPMTKSQALEFRKKWKTPPRITPKKGQGDALCLVNSPVALRLKDTEKGLECVGRNLAEEYQVSWKEYWPFLNNFVDFRTNEGLTKLDEYLKQKYITCDLNRLYEKMKLCVIKKKNRKTDENIEFFTAPSSPKLSQEDSDNEMQIAEEGSTVFIEGIVPTTVDHAVYNALASTISSDKFPNVYRWRHDMQLVLKRDPNCFQNLRSKKKLFAND